MQFYDCSTAPSPRRVRVFIAEKGIDIPTIQVDLRNGEHLGDAFRAINPHCTVPVLRTDGGASIFDTAAICQYLEELFPECNLMGRDAEERAVVQSWYRNVEFDGALAAAECLRNRAKGMQGRALTGPENIEQIPELAERGRKRCRSFLARMEKHLGNQPYVAGQRYTMADIGLLVAVDFMKWIHEEIPEDAANLRRWYDEAAARPGSVS